MQLETLTFTRDKGWSIRPFPALDSEQTLVVVFGAPAYGADAAPIRELRAAFPRSCFVGCSTSGEISGADLADDSLTVAIARLEHSDLASASAHVAGPQDSFGAGVHLAETLTREDLRAILVLSDGVQVNGSELVRGLNSKVPENVVVTGGLAGDGDRFQSTWVLGEEGPDSGMVAAVGLYGDRLRIGHGSKGGWDIFGPERVITRSRGNVLYELDGKPALELYKSYLGERASGLPATALLFPLAVRSADGEGKVLVRTILGVDESAQSMTFAGDMPEGHLAQLMRANFDRLVLGASEAALETRRTASLGQDLTQTLAIAISCVGRRLILGARTEDEIEAALAELPEGTRQIGFYSYGEISPFASGHCDLHNQTMTLTTISES
ncbi:MAG TPA: FIST N-terminal domain-containing protein [Planctomycetota bacterium]|nr:FIST N-terminal domain-containing protein [Planctomycetota bacterium]